MTYQETRIVVVVKGTLFLVLADEAQIWVQQHVKIVKCRATIPMHSNTKKKWLLILQFKKHDLNEIVIVLFI